MNKYQEAYKLASNLTPRDLLDKKVRESVDLLKEACDKAEKYDEINRVYLKNEVMESADINAERLQQLYEDMQPFIDKAIPFIGSIMNKYQEAINELYKQRAERYKVYQKHKDWSKEIKEYDKVGEALETLQELVDQTKTHTLEEVKKEWEELGYEWIETDEFIFLDNDIEEITIKIYKSSKLYYVKELGEDYYEIVSFALHQLLTKTFKALGWFDE